jgi:quinol-cytochrome oxidoreductase complex cytochrome b subunit
VFICVVLLITGPCIRHRANAGPTRVLVGKWFVILAGVILAVMGTVLTALATNDPDACVNLRETSIWGTLLTGCGIIVAAAASV